MALEGYWHFDDITCFSRSVTVIGDAIQKVADQFRYTSVQEFCGHGLGRNLHMAPSVLHFI